MSACKDCSQPTFTDFHSDNLLTWCTNCGNYGIQAATKKALAASNVCPKDTVLVYDIGCNGNGADKMAGFSFHGLHGRAISLAAGVALANSKLTVIASAGDGATFSEGINHLVHAIRSNYNMTFLLHNNSNYGLTKGQASATTRQDVPMSVSPDGVTADTMNPAHFALTLGNSFVARTFSGDVDHMSEMIKQGIEHKGFSFIEILQYCPTYNKATTHEWYQERVFDIKDHDTSDLQAAIEKSKDIYENIALGVLYRDDNNTDFMTRQPNRAQIQTELVDEVQHFDSSVFLEKYK